MNVPRKSTPTSQVWDKDRHIQELESTVSVLSRKLQTMLEEKAIKTSILSLKWRKTALYYRQRCRDLGGAIRERRVDDQSSRESDVPNEN
jgi:hypothetical protein